MASDLLSIARSGARVARAALDVTAQNIANAATQGYVRRSVQVEEVSAAGGLFRQKDISLSGARVAGLTRNADLFRQTEARRTAGEAARGGAELAGLQNIEAAIEQSQVFDLVVDFEAALLGLQGDPADPALRAQALASAGNMASGFTIAANSLAVAGDGLRFQANAEIAEINVFTQELARVNLRMARAGEGSSDKATLLDQRDSLLARISQRADISATFNSFGMAEVRLGSATGAVLVSGGGNGVLASTTQADGTLAFTVDGAAASLSGGSIGGRGQALATLAGRRTELDTLAAGVINTANTAQGNGAALDGSAGPPMFSGGSAASMALALSDGAQIAAAAAGAPPGSTDGSNLANFRASFASAGHAQGVSALIFAASADVSGRKITNEALTAIASAAQIALDEQSGVDLDQEAANLVRFQQAFQASGRVMQVASDLFDTLLGIR